MACSVCGGGFGGGFGDLTFADVVEDLGLGLDTTPFFFDTAQGGHGHGQKKGRGRRKGRHSRKNRDRDTGSNAAGSDKGMVETAAIEGVLEEEMTSTTEEEKEEEVDKRFVMPVDVIETYKEQVFVADIPGATRDDTTVQIEKRVLSIGGKRKARDPAQLEDGAVVRHRERRGGFFRRRFKLPKNADTGGARAELKDGILRVTVPKRNSGRRDVVQVPLSYEQYEEEVPTAGAPAEPPKDQSQTKQRGPEEADTQEGSHPAAKHGERMETSETTSAKDRAGGKDQSEKPPARDIQVSWK